MKRVIDNINREGRLVGTTHLPFVWDKVIETGGDFVDSTDVERAVIDDNDNDVNPMETSDNDDTDVEDSVNPGPSSNQAQSSTCTSGNCGPRTRSGRVRHDEFRA